MENINLMKTTFTLLLLFVMAFAMAQTKTNLPRTEFAIAISENSLNIKPGESKRIMVSVLRSKSFAKSKALMGFSNMLPEGITAYYEPTEGNFETTELTFTAGPTSMAGTYQIVLNSTLNHKTKGSILKLSVSNDNVASK